MQRVAKYAHDTVLEGRRGEDGEPLRVVENAVVLGEDWADINTLS